MNKKYHGIKQECAFCHMPLSENRLSDSGIRNKIYSMGWHKNKKEVCCDKCAVEHGLIQRYRTKANFRRDLNKVWVQRPGKEKMMGYGDYLYQFEKVEFDKKYMIWLRSQV